MSDYFPLKILYTETNEIAVVHSPDDIISGKGFKVLECNTKE